MSYAFQTFEKKSTGALATAPAARTPLAADLTTDDRTPDAAVANRLGLDSDTVTDLGHDDASLKIFSTASARRVRMSESIASMSSS